MTGLLGSARGHLGCWWWGTVRNRRNGGTARGSGRAWPVAAAGAAVLVAAGLGPVSAAADPTPAEPWSVDGEPVASTAAALSVVPATAAGAVLVPASLPAAAAPGSLVSPASVVAAPVADAALAAPGEAVNTAIAYALAQIGLPYVWGGNGPAAGDAGFDCSGLTTAAYASAGIRLPRTAHTQFQAGPRLSPGAELLPGDLVFYGTLARVHHVGMYLGGGRMVNAPRRGKPIQIAQVRYPGDDYLGATRPAAGSGPAAGPFLPPIGPAPAVEPAFPAPTITTDPREVPDVLAAPALPAPTQPAPEAVVSAVLPAVAVSPEVVSPAAGPTAGAVQPSGSPPSGSTQPTGSTQPPPTTSIPPTTSAPPSSSAPSSSSATSSSPAAAPPPAPADPPAPVRTTERAPEPPPPPVTAVVAPTTTVTPRPTPPPDPLATVAATDPTADPDELEPEG